MLLGGTEGGRESAGRTIGAGGPMRRLAPRSLRMLAAGAALLIALALAAIRVCADGGAMAGPYRTCDCAGLEWRLYDRTAADGPRRTLCVGWVRSRTCHASMAGPTVPCGEK